MQFTDRDSQLRFRDLECLKKKQSSSLLHAFMEKQLMFYVDKIGPVNVFFEFSIKYKFSSVYPTRRTIRND